MSDKEPTAVQLQILRQRYPGIGEPALRRNWRTLLTPDEITDEIKKPDLKTFLIAEAMSEAAPKRIRQQMGDGMNNWERQYLLQLDVQWSHVYREVSLPLANGLRYKVDFLVASTAGDRLVVEGHEVKGQARSTGIAKVKMAARLYPWITFKLATKRRKAEGGGWAIEPVLP